MEYVLDWKDHQTGKTWREIVHGPPYGRVDIVPQEPVNSPAAMQPVAPPMTMQPPATMQQGNPPAAMQQVSPPPQVNVPTEVQAPQPGVAQQAVAKWKDLLDTLSKPEIFGPLQTFLGVIAQPLRPGEPFTARLAHATGLMNLHKQMLLEAEDIKRKRELEFRKLQSDIDQTTAETDFRRLLTDKGRIELEFLRDKLRVEYENSVKDGRIKDAELIKKNLEAVEQRIINQYKPQTLQATIDYQNRIGLAALRGKDKGGEDKDRPFKTQEEAAEHYRSMYYNVIDPAFKDWLANRRDEDKSFATFLKESPAIGRIYQDLMKIYAEYGLGPYFDKLRGGKPATTQTTPKPKYYLTPDGLLKLEKPAK